MILFVVFFVSFCRLMKLKVCLKSESRVIEDYVFTGIRNLVGFFLDKRD